MWNGSRIGKNVIFGVYWFKKKKDILILGKSTTDGLDDATITAGTEYSINFTEQDKKIWLSESIMQWKQFFFNGVKICQFKVRSLKYTNLHCVWVTFQKAFQLIIWKN